MKNKYHGIITPLEGWLSDEKYNKLYDLIINSHPTNLVEIGVFGGKSFFTQAFALKENGHGKIIGIDPWNVENNIEYVNNPEVINWWSKIDYNLLYTSCQRFINTHNLEQYAELKKVTSHDYITHINFDIDILHIDGNHEEESSCRDVELYLPKIKSGGYVWFDDATWHQTKSAIKLIEDKFGCILKDKARDENPINFCALYQKP